MPRKKKDNNIENIYSKKESFENLKTVQEMALNKRSKDDEITPDISIFLKAEELKGKLCGLYSDKTGELQNYNVMGRVVIDGKELKPKVGENIETGGNNDRTSEDT